MLLPCVLPCGSMAVPVLAKENLVANIQNSAFFFSQVEHCTMRRSLQQHGVRADPPHYQGTVGSPPLGRWEKILGWHFPCKTLSRSLHHPFSQTKLPEISEKQDSCVKACLTKFVLQTCAMKTSSTHVPPVQCPHDAIRQRVEGTGGI